MQYPNLPSTPVLSTKTDSVIRHMQYKIDSLSKVVSKTEIGHDFFSDVISTNLYMFATIIGLLALVSWGFFTKSLAVHKMLVDKRTNERIEVLEKELTTRLDDLSTALTTANYDINRAMFFSTSDNKNYSNEIGWALSSLQAFILKTPHPENKYLPEDFDTIHLWLNQIDRIIKELTAGDPVVKANRENIHSFLRFLYENISDTEITSRLNNIESELNHIIYSKPEPPENIMEGEPEAGPPPVDVDHEEVP